MALSASENPVIIAADATPQSRDIQIKWTDSIRAAIFEKHVGQSFKARDMTDPEQASRSYDVTITPGDVYTAVMYNESHTTTPDPNKSLTEPRPESILSVFGLADRRLELIADAKIESKGGTFVVFKVSTSAPTSALVQVGETVPVTDIVGLPSFEAPVVLEPEAASAGALTVHTLVATPLVPGRLYIAIILVSDKSGRWDFREIAFNTNKRRVSGTIDSIFIVNCGDPSIGEAQFWVDVHETGTSGADKVFRQFSLGNDEFNIINSQTIPLPPSSGLPWTFTIGPKKITPEVDKTVYLDVYGIEYDGPWADERARTVAPAGLLQFPTGKGKETVSSKSETVTAQNQTGGSTPFRFRLSFTWSVDYV